MGKIISNGITYGGGTNVVANPEGTPTDELSSIQIGNDIYSISGGGVDGDILIKDRNWTLLADTYGTTQLTKTYDYYLFVILQQDSDSYGLRLEDAHIIDSTVVDLENADRLYYSKDWKDNRGAYTTSGVEILPTEITLYSDFTRTVSCKLYGANAQSGGRVIDYSTEEQKTGLKWIDGSDVYQKTFTGTLGNSESTLIDSNFTSLLYNIIEANCFTKGQYGGISNGAISGNYWGCTIHFTEDGLSILANTNVRNSDYIATVKYTKITS